jgi:hypothetical protein
MSYCFFFVFQECQLLVLLLVRVYAVKVLVELKVHKNAPRNRSDVGWKHGTVHPENPNKVILIFRYDFTIHDFTIFNPPPILRRIAILTILHGILQYRVYSYL